jgi:SAM-dependent methyltransferase
MSGYVYSVGAAPPQKGPGQGKGAVLLGRARFNPSLRDPDYLVYRERRKLVTKWLESIPDVRLKVLDVGGRIQPYRPLMEHRLQEYIAVDPQCEGLVDVVAFGEDMPFDNESFDVVLCTQSLGYASDPFQFIREIHRVLRPNGRLFLSVPAMFPCHHDERWRILPDGLELLLADFSHFDIVPEGGSVAGVCRLANSCLHLAFSKNHFVWRVLANSVVPLLNAIGLKLDRFSRGNHQLTTNYSAMARK